LSHKIIAETGKHQTGWRRKLYLEPLKVPLCNRGFIWCFL